MSKTVYNKNGKKIVLLNPAEKGAKAAAELKMGYHITNDKQYKSDEDGYAIPLTDTQKAWRSGYLAARKDSADCYNAKNGLKSKAKKRGKRQKHGGNLPVIY